MTGRRLTGGEEVLARTVFDDQIDYYKVRLIRGPAGNPVARIALRTNGAITLGNRIYFREDKYGSDYSLGIDWRRLFIHEMTHVWQYRRLTWFGFLPRYLVDFTMVGFKPKLMYDYSNGASFAGSRLEAQADLVCDYQHALDLKDEARRQKLAKRLRGSGLFNLA